VVVRGIKSTSSAQFFSSPLAGPQILPSIQFRIPNKRDHPAHFFGQRPMA
jgi:hypothetical protein